MLGVFNSMKEAFLEYFVDNWQGHIALFIIAMIIVIIFAKQSKIRSATVYIPLLVLLLVILNPIVYKVIVSEYDYSYYRTFWLILLPFIIGAAVCLVIEKADEHKRFAALIMAVAAIMLTGPIVGTNHKMYPVKNIYRIDNQVIEVADIIMADKCENKKAMVPDNMTWQIRQYVDIKLLIGRSAWHAYSNDVDGVVYNMVHSKKIFSAKTVTEKLTEYDFPFLVLEAGMTTREDMWECGFENIGATDDYEVYRNVTW